MDTESLGLLAGWLLGIVELALAVRCWLSKECHFVEGELRDTGSGGERWFVHIYTVAKLRLGRGSPDPRSYLSSLSLS